MLYGISRPLAFDLLTAAARRRWLVLSMVVLATVVAWGVSLFTPVYYAAHSTLILKFGREYIYRPEVGDERERSTFDVEQALNGEVQILNSQEIKENVLDKIGFSSLIETDADLKTKLLNYIRTFNVLDSITLPEGFKHWLRQLKLTREQIPLQQLALEQMAENLEIKTIEKTPTIDISFQHIDRDVAVRILQTLIDVFMQKRLTIFGSDRYRFFDEQLNAYRSRLDEAEKALQSFKSANGVVDPERRTQLLMTQAADLETALKATVRRINDAKAYRGALSKGGAEATPSVPIFSNEEIAQLRYGAQELLRLRLEEENLLSRYKEGAGPVANVRGEIAKVLDYLEKQRRTGLQRVELELETANTQQTTLQRQLAQVNNELDKLEARGPELRDLQRRLEQAEADYKSYATKLEEERVTSQLDQEKISSVEIVQTPVASARSLGLPTVVKLVLGAFIGLLAGVGMAVAAEYRRDVLITSETVFYDLQVPVLAAIPHVRDDP